MVLFADFTEEPSCFGGNFAPRSLSPSSYFSIFGVSTWLICTYEGYFPNQAFVPSVLLPYKEKLRMTHLFEELTRTNTDFKMATFSRLPHI